MDILTVHRFCMQVVSVQPMASPFNTNPCTSCGRVEIVMRSCPGTNHPYRCTACRDKHAAKQQTTLGKLHIANHKLPQLLVMHVYGYLNRRICHSHARRKFLLAITMQGKGNTHSSLYKLHQQLAAQPNARPSSDDWYRLRIWGYRSDLWTKLTDLVIGIDARQPKTWCPWCHGNGCI